MSRMECVCFWVCGISSPNPLNCDVPRHTLTWCSASKLCHPLWTWLTCAGRWRESCAVLTGSLQDKLEDSDDVEAIVVARHCWMAYVSIFQCAGLIPANCCGGVGIFFPNVRCVRSDGVGLEWMPTEQVHLLGTQCWRECLLHCRIKMKKVMFLWITHTNKWFYS